MIVWTAASALMLAGGVAAATTAGAEEPPASSPAALPAGPSADGPGDPGAPRDDIGPDRDAQPSPAGPQQPGTADVEVPGVPKPVHHEHLRTDPAGESPTSGEPAFGDRDSADPDPGDPDPAGPAAADRAVAEAAGTGTGTRPRPAPKQLALVAQQSGGNLAVATRRRVTVADVSASPSAPVQQRVLALINQMRRLGGCNAVQLDPRLIDAATRHATDMARRRYFAHESRNGRTAGDRVRVAGYRWQRYGENIARGAVSPYDVVYGWMHSPPHRKNIMDCRLREMGIGLAMAGRTPYWVQDFATPLT